MDNGNSPIMNTPMKSSNRFFKLSIQGQGKAVIASLMPSPLAGNIMLGIKTRFD